MAKNIINRIPNKNPKYLIIIGIDKIPAPIIVLAIWAPDVFIEYFPLLVGSKFCPSPSSGNSSYCSYCGA